MEPIYLPGALFLRCGTWVVDRIWITTYKRDLSWSRSKIQHYLNTLYTYNELLKTIVDGLYNVTNKISVIKVPAVHINENMTIVLN